MTPPPASRQRFAVTTFVVPRYLAEAARRDKGVRDWIADLPEIVAGLAGRWSLRVGEPFQPGGQCSWTAPVTDPAGAGLVLKVGFRFPGGDERDEAAGLRCWHARRRTGCCCARTCTATTSSPPGGPRGRVGRLRPGWRRGGLGGADRYALTGCQGQPATFVPADGWRKAGGGEVAVATAAGWAHAQASWRSHRRAIPGRVKRRIWVCARPGRAISASPSRCRSACEVHAHRIGCSGSRAEEIRRSAAEHILDAR